MGTIRDLDDIDRDKKEQMKKEMSKDASEVAENVLNNLEDIFKRKKIERDKKKPLWRKIAKLLGVIIALVFIFDLLFGSIWLLRFFIKSLFHI